MMKKTRQMLTRLSETLTKPRSRAAAAALSIDHPLEGERILPGHYAVRVTCENGDIVEVQVGEGQWQPCRSAVGKYWFDWYPSAAGEQVLAVRARTGKGKWRYCPVRTCRVQEMRVVEPR